MKAIEWFLDSGFRRNDEYVTGTLHTAKTLASRYGMWKNPWRGDDARLVREHCSRP
jgi:hypothetical protein